MPDPPRLTIRDLRAVAVDVPTTHALGTSRDAPVSRGESARRSGCKLARFSMVNVK